MTEQSALAEPEDALTGDDTEPFEIVVTEAGGITARLYALLRQTVPILEEPESVSVSCRQALASSIRRELAGRN
ncbi:hypothetical protein LBMAG21_03630 [Armatimonadota bacterium]|nr:hypothetical protein LBMAG21_03630 [Armatimonadota bacterium]